MDNKFIFLGSSLKCLRYITDYKTCVTFSSLSAHNYKTKKKQMHFLAEKQIDLKNCVHNLGERVTLRAHSVYVFNGIDRGRL